MPATRRGQSPFLAFPPDLRTVINTTNAIESINFPTDDAVVN